MNTPPEVGQLVIVRKRPFVVTEIAAAAAGVAKDPLPLTVDGLEALGELDDQKRQIVTKTRDEGLTKTYNRWNAPIRALLDSGQVQRQGEKRGAKYQATPSGSAA